MISNQIKHSTHSSMDNTPKQISSFAPDGFYNGQKEINKYQQVNQNKHLVVATQSIYSQQKQSFQAQSQQSIYKHGTQIMTLEAIIDDMQKVIQEGKYIKAFNQIRKKLNDKELQLDAYIRLIRRFLHVLQKLMIKYLNFKQKRAKQKIEPLLGMYYESLNKFEMLIQILSGEQKSVEEASEVLGGASAAFIFRSKGLRHIDNQRHLSIKSNGKQKTYLSNGTKTQLDKAQNLTYIQSGICLSPRNTPRNAKAPDGYSQASIQSDIEDNVEENTDNQKEEIRMRNDTNCSIKSQASRAQGSITGIKLKQQLPNNINQQSNEMEIRQQMQNQARKILDQLSFLQEQLVYFQLKGLYISYRYYRKIEQNENALMFLNSAITLFKSIEDCYLNKEIIRLISQIFTATGNIHLEQENCQQAIIEYERSYEYSQKNINAWLKLFAQTEQQKITVKMEIKLEKVIQECIVTLTNWSMACEQVKDITKMMECLKLANWISQRLLLYEESQGIRTVTEENLNKMINKYQNQVEETCDINRIIKIIWNEVVAENENNEAEKMDQQGLDYFNSMFYKKFEYDKINKSQYICYQKEKGNNQSMDTGYNQTRVDTEDYSLRKQGQASGQQSPIKINQSIFGNKNSKGCKIYQNLVSNILPSSKNVIEPSVQNADAQANNEEGAIQSLSQTVSPRSLVLSTHLNSNTQSQRAIKNLLGNVNQQNEKDQSNNNSITHNSMYIQKNNSVYQTGCCSTTINSNQQQQSVVMQNNSNLLVKNKIQNSSNQQASASKSLSFNNTQLQSSFISKSQIKKTNQTKESELQESSQQTNEKTEIKPGQTVGLHAHSKSEYNKEELQNITQINAHASLLQISNKNKNIKSNYAWAAKLLEEGEKRRSSYVPKVLTTNKYFLSKEEQKAWEEDLAKQQQQLKQEANGLGGGGGGGGGEYGITSYPQTSKSLSSLPSSNKNNLRKNLNNQIQFEKMMEDEGLSYFNNQFRHLNLGDETEKAEMRQGVLDLDFAFRQHIIKQLEADTAKGQIMSKEKYMDKYFEFLKQMKMDQFDHREFTFSKSVVNFKKSIGNVDVEGNNQKPIIPQFKQKKQETQLNKCQEMMQLDVDLAVNNAITVMPILKQQADRKHQRLVQMLNSGPENIEGNSRAAGTKLSSQKPQSSDGIQKLTQKKVSYGQALAGTNQLSQTASQTQHSEQGQNALKHFKTLHIKNNQLPSAQEQKKQGNIETQIQSLQKGENISEMTTDQINSQLKKVQQITQESIRQCIRNNEQEYDNLQDQIKGFKQWTISQHHKSEQQIMKKSQAATNIKSPQQKEEGKKQVESQISSEKKDNIPEEQRGLLDIYPSLAQSTKQFIIRSKANKGNISIPEVMQLMKKTQGESLSPYLNKQKRATNRTMSKRFSISPIGSSANMN